MPDGVVGSDLGSRATTRPTTSRSSPTAACWSPPAARARSIASPATRSQPTLVDPRQRAAGHDARAPTATASALRHVESRQAVPPVGRPRRRAAPTRPTSATRRPSPRGARSTGRRSRRTARSVEISTRSGNTRTPDETWSDWSAAVRDAPTAARSPARARATCSGGPCSPAQRDEAPLLTSVTAAYLPRNIAAAGHIDHHPPAGHGVPAAVPDRRTGDRRLRRRHAGSPRRGAAAGQPPAARRTSAAAATRRVC